MCFLKTKKNDAEVTHTHPAKSSKSQDNFRMLNAAHKRVQKDVLQLFY